MAKILGSLKKYFVTGILVTFPISISIYVLFVVFRFIDGIIGSVLNDYFERTAGFYIPGLGFILFFAVILLCGFVSMHFLGKRFLRSLDASIKRFPFLGYIYASLRQVFELLLSEKRQAFKKVVLVEYPSSGRWAVGFIAAEGFAQASRKIGEEVVNVFIPWVPNPTSGYLAIVPRKNVILLDMSIKEAMNLIISGGIINPSDKPEDKDRN